MATGIGRSVVALVAAALGTGAFAQVTSGEPINAVHISGRIVASTGAPIQDRTVTFRNVTTNGRLQDSKLKTDDKGIFDFSLARGVVYQVSLTVAEDPLLFRGIGTIEVVQGQDVAMGDIVLEFSPRNEPIVHLVGPVQIKEPVPMPSLTGTSMQIAKARSIAAVYVACSDVPNEFCAGGMVHIVHGDGKEVQPPTDKEQVGSSSALISEDKRAAGWLVDYGNCCTSYPLSMKLMIYRPGKPLRGFKGDGRAIFDWHFVAGGKWVAFYQDFPHGTPVQHYELRDIATSRLIDKWDGDLTSKSPEWVKGLGAKSGF
jgi:hypothetical protein